MNYFQAFWHDFNTFTLEHTQFYGLISFSLVISFILWHWRQQDRKHVIATLLTQVFALSFLLLSKDLLTLELKPFSHGLHEVSLVISGITFVRLLGLFLFRFFLPLCHLNLSRIIEDITEIIGYIIWVIFCLYQAGTDFSSILTTSAVITGVLAFAMQDTLSNMLGGIALQLDNSIKIGDWIEIDDCKGRVSEVHWRFTAIETRDWEMIVIPNSVLMKSKFTVLGRRKNQALQLRRTIEFNISYKHLPGNVIDIVNDAIRNGNIKNVATSPLANCILTDLSYNLAHYALRYWLTDIEADSGTDSAVRIRINSALQRAGIDFSDAPQDIYLTHKDDTYERHQREVYFKKCIKALSQLELFNTLNEAELSQIAEKLVYTPFAKGDYIMRQGEIASWLFIIENGTTEVFLESSNGDRQLINTTQGQCLLGEMGLMTGAPRSATVVAKSDVLAYRLDKESFQKILTKRPELADEITKVLVARQFSIDNLQKSMDADAINLLLKQQQSTFLLQIRSFFSLA
jgi:small-conductance mechanosensitive channel